MALVQSMIEENEATQVSLGLLGHIKQFELYCKVIEKEDNTGCNSGITFWPQSVASKNCSQPGRRARSPTSTFTHLHVTESSLLLLDRYSSHGFKNIIVSWFSFCLNVLFLLISTIDPHLLKFLMLRCFQSLDFFSI